MPTDNTYGGSFNNTYNTQNTGHSYVGSYSNLPQGIYNAGGPGNNDNAYMGTVNPQSTVQYQMQGLLANGSPYIDQARQTGINMANSRGLLNSSIAAGNSQAAAIQSALPIAQQDASTYNTQDLTNQAALNQILQQRMQDTTSMNNANAAAAASRYATEMNNQGALARQRESLAYSGEQAGLNRNFQEYMQQLGYQNQLGLGQQAYQYGLGQSAFNLAGNLLQGNQNFRYNAGLNAMNNQFLLQNPSALGGYMDWIGQGFSGNINDLLNYAFGGGGSP